MTRPPPSDKPLFAYYGDDFTGSTDALEALALNGVDTVLFLKTPDGDDLRRFPSRAIGIAGDSRSRSPQWMAQALPAIFQRLRDTGAPVIQYKVCSTFDSSPATGSIGRALEIALDVFLANLVPVVPAAPLLQRHVVFGNMFAAGNGAIHRLDRHPAMRHHPMTPMPESDLCLHLANQTALPIALVDLPSLRAGPPVLKLPPDAKAVLFDGLDPSDSLRTARFLWQSRTTPQLFAIGSSGFTYGVLDYFRGQGWIPQPDPPTPPAPVDRLLVLSGSCSPATARQISTALRSGFQGIQLDPTQADWPAARRQAVDHLAAARSVVLYTALTHADRAEGIDRQQLAASMGRLLRHVVQQSGITRVVIAGGDTSSHAVRQLDLTALTYAAPLTLGAPLCRAHGGPAALQLVLKGGQVGSDDFFQKVMSWA